MIRRLRARIFRWRRCHWCWYLYPHSSLFVAHGVPDDNELELCRLCAFELVMEGKAVVGDSTSGIDMV